MSASLMIVNQRSLIYEIYDRVSKVVIGRVQVKDRRDLETKHPWVKEHIRDATEASGSLTGVRYIGETISKNKMPSEGINRDYYFKGMTR